jgi:alpha-amylase
MLAQPYGYPSVLSSYAFDCPLGNTRGPPSDPGGLTRDVACASSLETAQVGQWVCEHRDPYILHMAAFRRMVAGTAIVDWWDNGANAIAFSRGDKGFVAINNETTATTATVETSLPSGTYCDRLTGGLVGGSCAGTSVVVAAAGTVQLDLPAGTAIAIDAGVRL